eukprot:1494341-Rhodomonas_salina.1
MAIPLQDIMRVNGTDGQFKLSTDEKKVQKAVIVDYEGAGGAASLVHLRGGFCWAPSYHWQLHVKFHPLCTFLLPESATVYASPAARARVEIHRVEIQRGNLVLN